MKHINDTVLREVAEEITTGRVLRRPDTETAKAAIEAYELVKPTTIGSDNTQTVYNLLGVLADIRQKTGVGDKPMLSELADALGALIPKWQPIETAPNQTLCLLTWYDFTFDEWDCEVAMASYGKRNSAGYSNRSYHGRATHWMPLPVPPSEGLTTTPVSESKQPRKMTVQEVEKMVEPHISDEVYCDQGDCEGQWSAAKSVAKALAKLGAIEVVGGV